MERRKFLLASGATFGFLSGCSMPGEVASGAQLEIDEVKADRDFDDVVIDVLVSNSGTKRGNALLVVQIDTKINTYDKEREISVSAGDSEQYRFNFEISALDLFTVEWLGRVKVRIED